VGRDDARDQVERNQALGARAVLVLVAIHRKGDAHAAEDHLGRWQPTTCGRSDDHPAAPQRADSITSIPRSR
jgi:hypothetical protein